MRPAPNQRHTFSVIIPTRHRPALLLRALHSALDQEGESFEVIVADDGAGEGVAAAEALADSRVHAFATGAVGQVPARNHAIRRARGRWIAFLDDDDWWADRDHLAALAGRLRDGEGLVFASGRIVREGAASPAGPLAFTAGADPQSLRRDNTLLVSGIAYAGDLHDTLGPFDETLPVYWDWDWYLRLAAAGIPFADSGAAGVRISVRDDNTTAPANAALRRAELARLCAKHGLTDVVLKNHEIIAQEQAGATG